MLHGQESGSSGASGIGRARSKFAYTARSPDELTFERGVELTILSTDDPTLDPGWWKGTLPNGQMGIFPANYVQTLGYGGGGGGAPAAAEAVGGGEFHSDAESRTVARTESSEVSEVVHSKLGWEPSFHHTGERRAQGQTIARLFLDAATGNATEKRNKAVEGLADYIRSGDADSIDALLAARVCERPTICNSTHSQLYLRIPINEPPPPPPPPPNLICMMQLPPLPPLHPH